MQGLADIARHVAPLIRRLGATPHAVWTRVRGCRRTPNGLKWVCAARSHLRHLRRELARAVRHRGNEAREQRGRSAGLRVVCERRRRRECPRAHQTLSEHIRYQVGGNDPPPDRDLPSVIGPQISLTGLWASPEHIAWRPARDDTCPPRRSPRRRRDTLRVGPPILTRRVSGCNPAGFTSSSLFPSHANFLSRVLATRTRTVPVKARYGVPSRTQIYPASILSALLLLLLRYKRSNTSSYSSDPLVPFMPPKLSQ